MIVGGIIIVHKETWDLRIMYCIPFLLVLSEDSPKNFGQTTVANVAAQ